MGGVIILVLQTLCSRETSSTSPHARLPDTHHVQNDSQFVQDRLGSQLYHAEDTWWREAADTTLPDRTPHSRRPSPPAPTLTAQ